MSPVKLVIPVPPRSGAASFRLISQILAACVRESDRDYGDRRSISTKHWNDK